VQPKEKKYAAVAPLILFQELCEFEFDEKITNNWATHYLTLIFNIQHWGV